jgi:hypothetical protein
MSVAERAGGLITAQTHFLKYLALAAGLYLSTVALTSVLFYHNPSFRRPHVPPPHADGILAMCQHLQQIPGPPENFLSRTESDRYLPGTLPIFIKDYLGWQGSRGAHRHKYHPRQVSITLLSSHVTRISAL